MAGATEKGFGTGLRAQLEKKQGGGAPAPSTTLEPTASEPRSVSEAIAAATLHAEGVAELQAELDASLEREQELRASLAAQARRARARAADACGASKSSTSATAQLAAAEAAVAARERVCGRAARGGRGAPRGDRRRSTRA